MLNTMRSAWACALMLVLLAVPDVGIAQRANNPSLIGLQPKQTLAGDELVRTTSQDGTSNATKVGDLFSDVSRAKGLAGGAPVNIVLMGQSIWDGPIPITYKAAYPAVFTSTKKPGLRERRVVPQLAGNNTPMLYDKLYTQLGYDADIANATVSGMNIFHATGQIGARPVSAAAFKKRTGANYPDLGDFGDLVTGLTGGTSKIFNVTGGSNRQAWAYPPFPSNVAGYYVQNMVTADATGVTGASSPDATSVAIGGTLTDGGVTYTRVDESLLADDGQFYPGNDGTLNGGAPNRNWGGFLGEGSAGRGWDPMGIIATADRLRLQQGPAPLTIVYWEQGQSNLGITGTAYKKGLMLSMNYFLRRGCTVVIGTPFYSPGSSGASPANYQVLSDNADQAVTELSVFYPGQVFRGANLFTKFGTNGIFSGQRATGGTGGVPSTTITVSAVTGGTGTGIAVGQNAWDRTTPTAPVYLGKVTAASTGGVGTVTLDTAATLANGTALGFFGTGLQGDGIHQHPSAVDAIAQSAVDALAAGPLPKTSWAP